MALTVLAESWSHVSLIRRVREIRADPELTDIDRIARHYTGSPYAHRGRDSWTAVVEVERWHGWGELAVPGLTQRGASVFGYSFLPGDDKEHAWRRPRAGGRSSGPTATRR